MCLLLSPQSSLSFVSVVFDFNALLNDAAPMPLILLSVDVKGKEKSELLIDILCVLFLLSLPHRFSSVSAVFDFSDSLNDTAPVSPILFTVVVKIKRKRVICWWMSFVCLLSFVFTTQIEYSECCVRYQ